MAHDEYIEFSIEGNTILYQGEESEISAGKIRVEFINRELVPDASKQPQYI